MRYFLAVVFALAVSRCGAVEIVAHRGASADAPENTLAAVKLAWAQGADAVEIDVTLSKDGRIVVLHDETTGRLAGRDRAVGDQTFAELRQLDVGAWKGERFRGERIPLLSEVLATVPKGRRLFVELKAGPEILSPLERVLDDAGERAGRVTLIGFKRGTLAEAKRRFPRLRAYWLSRKVLAGGDGPDPAAKELIAKAREAGLDGLDVQGREAVDEGFVRSAKAAGLSVYVWSVDEAADAKRLAAAGVDGVTTDRPGGMREELGAGRKGLVTRAGG